MTYLKSVLLVFVCSLVAFGQDFSLPTEPSKTDYEPLFLVGNGERVFHQGKFGNINGDGLAAQLLEDFSPLKGTNVDLVEVKNKTDHLGKRHVRVQQFINGREVVGGEMIVHADGNGDVYAVNGRFGNAEKAAVNPRVNSRKAIARA